MLIPSGQFRVFLATMPLDMRAGIDRIAELVKTTMAMNPYGGAVFLFFSRDRTRAKIYFYDGTGSCLFLKRLERGRFKPPRLEPSQSSATLPASELALLLEGVDVRKLERPEQRWQPKAPTEGDSSSPLAP